MYATTPPEGTPMGDYVQIKDIVANINKGGMIIEFGVHLGNTFWEICDDVFPRHVYGFDSFLGLPEDWHPATLKGTYSTLGQPPAKPKNGEYIIGYVQDTLEAFVRQHSQPVDFAHFDMNIGSATTFALKHIEPLIRDGTVFLFDDIFNPVSEQERIAFEEFLTYHKIKADMFARRSDRAAAYKLTR